MVSICVASTWPIWIYLSLANANKNASGNVYHLPQGISVLTTYNKYKMYLPQANPYGRTSLATTNEHSPAAHSSEARVHYQPHIQIS